MEWKIHMRNAIKLHIVYVVFAFSTQKFYSEFKICIRY